MLISKIKIQCKTVLSALLNKPVSILVLVYYKSVPCIIIQQTSSLSTKLVSTTGEEVLFKKIKLTDDEGSIPVCLWRDLASTKLYVGDHIKLTHFNVTDTFNNQRTIHPVSLT